MLPAYSLDEIRRELARAFQYRYGEQSRLDVRMTGILFAPKGSDIASKEIRPRMDDFHHRSGNNIDFFCAGYGAYWPPGWVADEETVATTTSDFGHATEWKYSSKYFNDLLKEVRREAKTWAYSGEVDLILLNAFRDTDEMARLDFSVCLSLPDFRMKADGVIQSVGELFEQIFAYAECASNSLLVQNFSDSKGLSVARSWLTDLATSYLPAKLGDVWKSGHHYAVVNLA